MRVLPSMLLAASLLFAGNLVHAQDDDDLLSLLGDDEPTIEYASAGFKTTRVVNAHSFENTGHGVLDLKISHRFGFISSGAYELFGLDGATIRLGLDYGVTDNLMIGFGRSSVEKGYDGFAKYKFLRQSTGARNMPISAAYLATVHLNSLRWSDESRENLFSSRLAYTHQLIIGRKFSESFSLQVMPTLVHRNLIDSAKYSNDVLSLGIAGRQKVTKRLAINFEYHYVLPDQIDMDTYNNSFTLGFDIETGGHVFQLHATNSTSMTEKGYITETIGDWLDGDIRFGFNVSRVFTVHRPNKRKRRVKKKDE